MQEFTFPELAGMGVFRTDDRAVTLERCDDGVNLRWHPASGGSGHKA